MKSSWAIGDSLGEEFQRILYFDHQEIDNPDRRHRHRLNYLHRTGTVISTIQKNFPEAKTTKVGDFGCGQGNVTLLLAEAGYEVFAVDADPVRIQYAQKKYERGRIHWMAGDIATLEFPPDFLDAAILGEIITVAPFPERMLEQVLRWVRPGGILVISLPNASRMSMNFPAWREFRARREAGNLGRGENGWENLFKMSLGDLREVVPANGIFREAKYCGGTVLINKYSQWITRPLPVSLVQSAVDLLVGIPILNRKICHNLCVVFEKG